MSASMRPNARRGPYLSFGSPTVAVFVDVHKPGQERKKYGRLAAKIVDCVPEREIAVPILGLDQIAGNFRDGAGEPIDRARRVRAKGALRDRKRLLEK